MGNFTTKDSRIGKKEGRRKIKEGKRKVVKD